MEPTIHIQTVDPYGWFWGWNPTGSSDDLELARALLAFELLCKALFGSALRSDLRR